MTDPRTAFVHRIHIRTTPEALWQALTDPAFTMRYWGAALHSDWQVGSPVLWQFEPDGEPRDLGERVLVSEPYRRLSYTWHNYQPEHQQFFGWSDEEFARLRTEPISKVTFELEARGDVVCLTLVHDGFAGDTEMLQAVSGRKPQSGGWPEILSSLKSLLETGEVLESAATPSPAAEQAGT